MLYYFLSVFITFLILILSFKFIDGRVMSDFDHTDWSFIYIGSIIPPIGIIVISIIMWIPMLFNFLNRENT